MPICQAEDGSTGVGITLKKRSTYPKTNYGNYIYSLSFSPMPQSPLHSQFPNRRRFFRRVFLAAALATLLPSYTAFSQSEPNVYTGIGNWQDAWLWSAGVPTAGQTISIGGTEMVGVSINSADAFSGDTTIHSDGQAFTLVEVTNDRTWTVDGKFFMDGGTTFVELSDGGELETTGDYALLGGGSGISSANVNVSGTGSAWTSNYTYLYSGSITAEDGGSLDFGGLTLIDSESQGHARVTVTGEGSNLYVGSLSIDSGSLTVQDGGQVTGRTGHIGFLSGTQGGITVEGQNSSLSLTEGVGIYNGDLTVRGGGTFTGHTLWVNERSEVTLSGSQSRINLTQLSLEGTLRVSGGAKLSSSEAEMGFMVDYGTTLAVSGEGSEWSNEGHLVIRNGTIRVEDGAKITTGTAYVATDPGLTNIVVSGIGSRWDNVGKFEVAENLDFMTPTSREITVENGGVLTAAQMKVEGLFFDTTINISGAGSQLLVAGTLELNTLNTGALNIQDGGLVSTGASQTYSSSVNITGAGSKWDIEGALGMMFSSMLIGDGGQVVSQTASVEYGFDTPDISNATVTGANSHWMVEDTLSIFSSNVRIENGGKLTVGQLAVSVHDYSIAAFQITGTEGSRGVVEAGTITIVPSTASSETAPYGVNNFIVDGGIIRANQDGVALISGSEVTIGSGGMYVDTQANTVSIASNLTGSGSLTKLGSGKLTLNGDNTYTGGTIVAEGALWVNGTLTGDVTIQDGAKLGGSGTLGELTVQDGGILAPGNSPGIMNTSTQTWGGAGVYDWETNTDSLSGTEGTNWDVILINGNLNITATQADPFIIALHSLTITNASGLIAGFDPLSDYTWEILRVTGTITGFDPSVFSLNDAAFLNDLEGGSFNVSQANQSIFVNFVAAPVPEPGSALLTLVACALFAGRRRRS